MASTYRIALAGPVPTSALDLITLRFGEVTPRTTRGWTVMEGLVADQAALRALLNTLWDIGAEIRLVRLMQAGAPEASSGGQGRPQRGAR